MGIIDTEKLTIYSTKEENILSLRKKRPLHVVISFCLGLLLALVLLISASAISSYSQNKAFSHTPFNYSNQSSAHMLSQGVKGTALVMITNNVIAPTNYLGVVSRLWNNDGTLVEFSGIVYNPAACYGFSADSGWTTIPDMYYADGTIHTYDGIGWWADETFDTYYVNYTG